MNNIEHIKKGSDTLIIVFSGFYKTKINTSFEWGLIRKTDKDTLYIKDDSQQWYLGGVSGVSTDVRSTTLYINDITRPYKRVIFIGSSMGGFAALLFGKLVHHQNKYIYSFSPQVVLLDYGYKPLLEDKPKDFDRFSNLSMIGPLPENTTVYYGGQNTRDHYQISYLACKRVTYDTDTHMIAKFLKDNGVLQIIVDRMSD